MQANVSIQMHSHRHTDTNTQTHRHTQARMLKTDELLPAASVVIAIASVSAVAKERNRNIRSAHGRMGCSTSRRTDTDTQTRRHADTQTRRHADTQTRKHTNRHRQTQTHAQTHAHTCTKTQHDNGQTNHRTWAVVNTQCLRLYLSLPLPLRDQGGGGHAFGRSGCTERHR